MVKKISIVIPNYNGEKLLKKNLQKVIDFANCKEIIVVDDFSSDNSVAFIKNNFLNVILIENEKNLGFAKSANIGVKKASQNLVLLLNSDILPQDGFLSGVEETFTNNSNLFGLALSDISHENNRLVTRGKGTCKFKKGMFIHLAGDNLDGDTLWVSGGSGVFDKKKFLMLGGFDEVFSPFYWEDIDLSYRAWKMGFQCIYIKDLKVNHFHSEGAIKTQNSEKKIKTISYRNQFLFIWKNIEDVELLLKHLVFLPYYLTVSVIKKDFELIIGFVFALLSSPKIVFKDSQNYKLTDKEVINKFAK